MNQKSVIVASTILCSLAQSYLQDVDYLRLISYFDIVNHDRPIDLNGSPKGLWEAGWVAISSLMVLQL